LYDLIQSQGIILYPDKGMRLAASRAVAKETPRGWRIAKEMQSHKIDVIVALAMAAYAAVKSQGESLFLGFGPGAPDWLGYHDLAEQDGGDGMAYARRRKAEEEIKRPEWYLETLARYGK